MLSRSTERYQLKRHLALRLPSSASRQHGKPPKMPFERHEYRSAQYDQMTLNMAVRTSASSWRMRSEVTKKRLVAVLATIVVK